jgi:hypothetical protein
MGCRPVVVEWNRVSDVPFWALLALFFPAVTGFTQGGQHVRRSARARTSNPLGTFLAVGISFVV